MYLSSNHLHFIGIGGMGMSSLAQLALVHGYRISGCDIDISNPILSHLKSLGCLLSPTHNSTLCNHTDIAAMVYSTAIARNMEELLQAQSRNIPILHRAQMLAHLMHESAISIGISGAHGKTTTTSMIGHLLATAGFDPSVIVGGNVPVFNGNVRVGNEKYFVTECDESDRSFLFTKPTYTVVTNIDLEHLETYKDLDDIKNTYKRFITDDGVKATFLNLDDEHLKHLFPVNHPNIVWFSINDPRALVYCSSYQLHQTHSTIIVKSHHVNQPLGTITIPMPGLHNISNALASIAIGLYFNVSFSIIKQALETFTGVDRRFTFKGTYNDIRIFDDYGHHPKEIEATIKVARAHADQKLIMFFQPHRYTRTQKLWDHFITVFKSAPLDALVITDIYPASEHPIDGINSVAFIEALKKQSPSYPVLYAPLDQNMTHFLSLLDALGSKNDLVVLQGAGNINQLVKFLPLSF